MGYFYFGTVESESKYSASYIAGRHSGMTFTFSDDELCKISSYVLAPDEKADRTGWYITFFPSNVTESGISDEKEARHATEFANIFYAILRNEKEYRWAATGVEVEDWLSYDELLDRLSNDDVETYDGLVISNDMFQKTSDANKKWFVMFTDTHMWIPFKKETFRGE